MEIKAKDMCPRCKHCLGMTPQGMYSCGKADDGSELNIGIDAVLDCAFFEWKDEKVEGRYPWGSDKDNFDECIRQMRIIDELKTENARLKETTAGNYKASIRKDELIKSLRDEKKAKDEEIKRLEASRDRLITTVSELVFENRVNKKTIVQLKEILENESGSKIVEENTKLKERIKNLQTTNEESYKREEELEDKCHKLERRLNEKVCRMKQIDCELILPLTRVLYPRENKIYKPYSEVINDIKDLKVYSGENETMYEDLKYWKERCHNAETDVTTLNSKVEVLDKRNTNQSVIIGEKGKEIENLTKKNRELQIRFNDLIFQHQEDTKKIIELKDDKYRILNENECLRNRYPTYSAMKAEDKIEHIQKEAKKWKRKYKEAYDILQEFFGEHSNIMSISYDLSGDFLTLKLSYDDRSNCTKYKNLENARERMKKLD